MRRKHKGRLIIIGGKEEKSEGERIILREVAKRAKDDNGGLVIITVATHLHDEVAEEYTTAFQELGVDHVQVLGLRSRHDAYDDYIVRKISDAKVIFFTGGDQLRITSQMGNTPALEQLRRAYEEGATIAGTSAGAAAMPETMLISGPGRVSNAISTIGMAPGLGLVREVVIDSHFAERGRFGRLLGAVVQNPQNLGLGIDEDTAIITLDDGTFKVIGAGAVYVFDGSSISYSSLSETNPEGIVSIFDVKLHVLKENNRFDVNARRPIAS